MPDTHPAALRALSTTEATVVDMLIADAENVIADLTRVLAPDEQAVRDVRAACGWLRGVRDTRTVTAVGLREERARLVRGIWVATVLDLVPEPKPSWTAPFDDTGDFQREADARIGEGVAAAERARLTRNGRHDWPEEARVAAIEVIDRRSASPYLHITVPMALYLATDILDAVAPIIRAAAGEES